MKPLRIHVDLGMPADVLELLRDRTAGHELVFPAVPIASVLAKAIHDSALETVDVAFGQPDPVAIGGAERLKWIHVSSSGITRYDTPEFRASMAERGILVSNSAGVYNEACAMHVLSFMLAQARNLAAALRSHAGSGTPEWNELRSTSSLLRGETVLILGYGAIGKRLVELLAPFGTKVIAHRRNPRGDEGIPVITDEQLLATLAETDHVVNILPESGETRGFFNDSRFEAIKAGSVFYNIGRGKTVDQEALLRALSTRLRAAWLDVTDPEPLPDGHPLWSHSNCFITPHIAGGHANETRALVTHFLDNFDRFVRGDPLVDRVM